MHGLYRFIYIFMIIAGAALIYSTMRLLVKRRMTEVNSILWFVIGLVTILAGCCPEIVTNLAAKLYIEYSPAFVFMAAILILLLIVFENTVMISDLTSQVQELAIQLSIMEEELARVKTAAGEQEPAKAWEEAAAAEEEQ